MNITFNKVEEVQGQFIVDMHGGEYIRFTPSDKRERIIHVDGPSIQIKDAERPSVESLTDYNKRLSSEWITEGDNCRERGWKHLATCCYALASVYHSKG